MKQKINQLLRESIAVKEQLLKSHVDAIATIATQCAKTLKRGGKIIFCGNGGSAADSQHLAAEFVVRFKRTGAHLQRSPSTPIRQFLQPLAMILALMKIMIIAVK